MKNINIQNIIEQLKALQNAYIAKWQIFASNSLVQSLRLDKPLTILLMFWPALWGFFYGSSSLLIFLKLLLLMISLRIVSCLYDDITTPEIEITGDRRHMQKPPILFLLIGIVFSGVIASQIYPGVLFLILTWFILVAIYPYIFKMIWWPQVYGGVIFGLWPALIGVTSGGEISFNSILICFAAFFWMVALETAKASYYKNIDMDNSLKSVALWMGDKSISFMLAGFVLTFVFLVFSGMAVNASGFYYACLMLAELILIKSYYLGGEISPKIHLNKVYISALIAIGLLFGV